MRTPWKEEEVKLLQEYKEKGYEPIEITKKLNKQFNTNRSINSINNKIRTIAKKEIVKKKICKKCGYLLDINEFNKDIKYKDGHKNICKTCMKEERWKKRHLDKVKEQDKEIFKEAPKERKCCICNKVKPITEFHKDRRAKGGYRYICKTCASTKNREYVLKRVEKKGW